MIQIINLIFFLFISIINIGVIYSIKKKNNTSSTNKPILTSTNKPKIISKNKSKLILTNKPILTSTNKPNLIIQNKNVIDTELNYDCITPTDI